MQSSYSLTETQQDDLAIAVDRFATHHQPLPNWIINWSRVRIIDRHRAAKEATDKQRKEWEKK